MADIKGITIEIGGDTKKLTAALKDVNSSLKTTKTSLKDVDRLLKLNPRNVELLKQKQTLLASAIGDTKSRLDTLRTAMEQMRADGVDESSAEFQNLQREIIATEEELKRLEGEARNASSVLGTQMQAVGENIKDVGEKITAVGDSLTKNLTVPLAGIGAASIKAFSDVDKGFDIIVSKTGAVGDELEAMRSSMETLATEIPTDFETAGAAIGEVATRFDLTGQALEDLAGAFIKFAKLNNTDVSTAVDNVQSAMAAFGVATEDAAAFLDTLNAAAQKTGTSVDTISSTMTTNAAALKQMGMNASDAAFFIGQLDKNGVDASAVMSGLQRALANATQDGKSLDDALAELQETIVNSDTDTEAYAATMELFGNRAGPRLADALREGRISLEALGTSLDDNLGNVETTFENTLDPLDEFRKLMNKAKVTGASLGTTLLNMLLPVLEKAKEVVENLQKKWEELDDNQKDTIIKIGLIAASLGPVLSIVGRLTSGFGSLTILAGKGMTALSGLGGAGASIGASLGPILAVVAAVAALIAVFVKLYQENEDFRNKVNEVWPEIKETISGTLETLRETFQSFVDFVSIIWDQWGEEIWQVVSTKFASIQATISGALAVIQGLMQTFSFVIQGDWGGAWESLKQTAQTYWESIQQVIGSKVDNIRAKLELAGAIFSTIFGEPFEKLKQTVSQKLEDLRSKVQNIVERIKQIFRFDFPIPHIKLPHLTITGSLSLNPPSVPSFGVQWYRKAYENPFLFTQPTVIAGMGFGDGAGAEIVYGRDNLMKDIAAAAGGGIRPELIYEAVREGASDAKTTVVIDNREFARILRNAGVALA